jgi:hypothetical protein
MRKKLIMYIFLLVFLSACNSVNKEKDEKETINPNKQAVTDTKAFFEDVEEENISDLKEFFKHIEDGPYTEKQIKDELSYYQYYSLNEIEVTPILLKELIESERKEIEKNENKMVLVLVKYIGEKNLPDLVFWMEQIKGKFHVADTGTFQDFYYAFQNKDKYKDQLLDNRERQDAAGSEGIFNDNIDKHIKNARYFLDAVKTIDRGVFPDKFPEDSGDTTEITLRDVGNGLVDWWKPIEDPDAENSEYNLDASKVEIYYAGNGYDYIVTLIGSNHQIVHKYESELTREAVEKK